MFMALSPRLLSSLACLLLAAALAQAQNAPAAAAPEAAAAREGFYRFPALRGPNIVFTAEGDLWRVGLGGGRAERITTHPDLESRAALSPDGRHIAFTGAYERAPEAYLMPLAGGVPQRLSWLGQNPRIWGFTPAGEVLVTAPSVRGEPVTQLFAIDPRTQAQRVLPVGQASDGALSADGHILYFTRQGLGSDNVRAYRGGAMAQLWRMDLRGNAEAQALLPPGAGNDQRPLPYAGSTGPRVAFLSDRDGQFNLYSVDAGGGAGGGGLQQHTRHRGWDIRHAAIDGTRVVYALGADLHLIDLETGQDQRLAITLGGDADAQRARWVARPQTFFESARPAPDGQRVVLSVRGRIATQGTGLLRRAEMPVPADARCREAVYSHDNKHVFALCDIGPAGATPARAAAPVEQEIWRFPADGSGTPLQITRDAGIRRYAIFPSPDGRWLAHTDKAGRLTLTALSASGAGTSREVVVSGPPRPAPQQLVWSHDSQAFAFTRGGSDGYRQRLHLHHVATAQTLALTSDRYSSGQPAFTPDGRWLYFLSERSFVPLNPSPWGDRNLGPYFDRRSKVYALALQSGRPAFPFQPPDETQAVPAPEAATPAAPAASAPASAAGNRAAAARPTDGKPVSKPDPKTPARPAIELAGLAERLHEVPLAAGNYTRLRTDGKRLYLLEADSTPERRTSLRTLAIDNTGPQPELFAADVNDFELTPDGKRLLLLRRAATGPQPGDIQLMDAAAKLPTDAAVLARSQVRWADWQINTQPAAEWRQMFDDAWRLHRDHFYDARMHGADWPALRAKYGALLPRVGDRRELGELQAQMVAELGALHSQVGAEDVRRGPEDIAPAGLGARLSKVADGFRIEHIYRSDPELPNEASPLARVRARVGDVITSLNGRPLAGSAGLADLGELLRGQLERQVLLTLKSAAGEERRVVVLPVSAPREAALREGDWEQGRLERAAARSNGRVGYLRLRAMGRDDMATFAREFYAQLDREAIVIDVRNNNGGNIDSWVLTQLLRRAWAWWQPRSPEGTESYSNMQQAWRGHIAVLIDADTYSDGETFAEGIKRLQLGTLVGRRTAGAGVWLGDGNRLLDRGIVRAAETGQFALDGGWLIEGRGVTPDIDVDNPPRASHEGGDAQLDAAVNHLLRKLAEQPLAKPQVPPYRRP